MTWHTLKVIGLTLVAVLAVEIVVVGGYAMQAPKKYKCEKIEP